MSTTTILTRIRGVLLLLVGFICVGTIVELWLTEHTADVAQLIPFVLSASGLLGVGAMLLSRRRQTVYLFRFIMILMALGSLAGMVFHLNGNFALEMEAQPDAPVFDVFMQALQGANPPLAPGILALAGILGFIATYYHPALHNDTSTPAHERS